METASKKHDKDSRGHDAFPSGALAEPVVRKSVDRFYPPGMGLRPKACPRSRNATSTTTWSERPLQGPVDRCLTLVRAMDPDFQANDSFDPGVLMEASLDAQGTLTSDPRIVWQGPRPGQSANRDRTQSWWDVLPVVPKCGMPCFMCGAPCNRTLGKHFIRLADDNPAHLCCQHDLHELYGESAVNSLG